MKLRSDFVYPLRWSCDGVVHSIAGIESWDRDRACAENAAIAIEGYRIADYSGQTASKFFAVQRPCGQFWKVGACQVRVTQVLGQKGQQHLACSCSIEWSYVPRRDREAQRLGRLNDVDAGGFILGLRQLGENDGFACLTLEPFMDGTHRLRPVHDDISWARGSASTRRCWPVWPLRTCGMRTSKAA